MPSSCCQGYYRYKLVNIKFEKGLYLYFRKTSYVNIQTVFRLLITLFVQLMILKKMFMLNSFVSLSSQYFNMLFEFYNIHYLLYNYLQAVNVLANTLFLQAYINTFYFLTLITITNYHCQNGAHFLKSYSEIILLG